MVVSVPSSVTQDLVDQTETLESLLGSSHPGVSVRASRGGKKGVRASAHLTLLGRDSLQQHRFFAIGLLDIGRRSFLVNAEHGVECCIGAFRIGDLLLQLKDLRAEHRGQPG